MQTALTSFDGFASCLRPADSAPTTLPGAATLEEMSARIHSWLRQRNPDAPKVRIEFYLSKPGDYWFLLSHGNTCRWIYNFQKEQAELIHFRPDGEEALVCFGYEDQLWLTAKTDAERDFYRQQFNLYLRGDADYFRQPCHLTLEPLRNNPSEALDPSGLQGITQISLQQEEVDAGGAAHQLTTKTADAISQTGANLTRDTHTMPGTGRLIRARFLIQFAGSTGNRVVEICPPYSVGLERPSDLAAVARWLSRRAFIRPPMT